jgi:hypothetical protein
MAETEAVSPGQRMADPQREIVENVCARLIFDGCSLLRLREVNPAWRKLVSDPTLWDRMNAARFGPKAKLRKYRWLHSSDRWDSDRK